MIGLGIFAHGFTSILPAAATAGAAPRLLLQQQQHNMYPSAHLRHDHRLVGSYGVGSPLALSSSSSFLPPVARVGGAGTSLVHANAASTSACTTMSFMLGPSGV